MILKHLLDLYVPFNLSAYIYVPHGKMTISGTASVSISDSYISNSRITVSGISLYNIGRYIFIPSGKILIVGAALCVADGQFIYIATGKVHLSGTSSVFIFAQYVTIATGKIIISGTSLAINKCTFMPTGKIIIGGTALSLAVGRCVVIVTGNILVGGIAICLVAGQFIYFATGTIILSGMAQYSYSSSNYVVIASGTIYVNSIANYELACAITGIGKIVVTGAASCSYYSTANLQYVPFGQVTIGGIADYFYSANSYEFISTAFILVSGISRPIIKQAPPIIVYFPVPGIAIPPVIPVVGIKCCAISGLSHAAQHNCPIWPMASYYPSYYNPRSRASGVTPAYLAGVTRCIQAKLEIHYENF